MSGDIRDSIGYKRGMGNWRAWGSDLAPILDAAEEWRSDLAGIDRPWLCWNVDDDWCLLQQRLVESAGWVPVVGFDPRVGPPKKLSSNAVVVDFNRLLKLPVLYPHFPLEFCFLFAERLAFWHSDLLLTVERMRAVASTFAEISQGCTAAVKSFGFKELFNFRERRYWELIGCTTRDASRSQFDCGCGWWMRFHDHVNSSVNISDPQLRDYYWDHGSGIYYWHRRHGGRILELKERDFSGGHFSQIKFGGYVRVSPDNEFRDLSADLSNNFVLADCAKKVGVSELL